MTGKTGYLVEFLDFYMVDLSDFGEQGSVYDSEMYCLSPEFKLPDENQVLLKIPRQNNMYSFNLENIVPSGGLACLIAKATIDESNKCHRSLQNHPDLKTDEKRRSREEEQAFLDELERLKRQEKEANEEAEALRGVSSRKLRTWYLAQSGFIKIRRMREELLSETKQGKSLKKFDFVNVKTASTPIETQKPLVKVEDRSDGMSHLYWLSKGANPTGDSFLAMQKSSHSVATSIPRAEYVVLASVREACTICIVKNPIYHSKTKHIAIRHHFIRDAYEKKLIQVLKIHTDDNVADLLTKAFDVSRFQFLVVSIGMISYAALVKGRFRESLRRVINGTEALLLPTLFILWLDTVSTDSAKLVPLGKHNMVRVSSETEGMQSFSRDHDFLKRSPSSCSHSSIRSDLLFDDANGIDSLPNQAIFDAIQLMGHLDAKKKFVMYPRFISIFLDKQLASVPVPLDHFPVNALTSKVFSFMVKKVQRDPLFEKIPEDTHDYIESENAQDVGRTRDIMGEEKEYVEDVLSTEDILSTNMEKVVLKGEVSTDEQRKGIDDHTKEGSVTQNTQPPPTSTIFGDDETITKVLLNMSHAKAVSREKEKCVELKDIEETDRPKPTSTRSLLTLNPLPTIDPKDKERRK
ncbi:hypothetical protein Tco_1407325 [Tanacetum coccineum]